MESENIKNKIKKEKEKFKNFFQNINDPEPDRDWFAIIFIFLVMFIIISVWSVALYFLYFPTAPVAPVTDISYGSVDEKKLFTIISAYEGRKKIMDDLQKNPPVFVDPSL